jgi:small subunit ribosomal protein S16
MRTGRKGQPSYRIVAVDGRKRRDGAYLERIGHYNPRTAPAELAIDESKALKWLKQGASPSDTVRSLLSRQGLLLAWDLQKKGVADEEIQERLKQFRSAKEAALREEAQAAKSALNLKRAKASQATAEAEASAPVTPEPATAPESEPGAASEGATEVQ